MELETTLIAETKDSTASLLKVGGEFFCFVLEDGQRLIKEAGRTRIPPGRYKVKARTHGGHYEKYKARHGHQFSIELMDVPNFTNILIHIGNFVRDTEGCLLVNYGVSFDTATQLFKGVTSTAAYLNLYQLLATAFDANEPVFITINR